jgi:acetyl esterase
VTTGDGIELDPEIALILEETAALDAADRSSLAPAEARLQMAEGCRVWNRTLPPMAEVVELAIPAGDRSIPARLFRPENALEGRLILNFHGGGFVLGSIDTHHRMMRCLAEASGAAVLGVDYRLAPEHPFPAALEDGLAALRWLEGGPKEIAGGPEKIVLAGDSAGANLALSTLLKRRDEGLDLPAGAALFYGCYWSRLGTDSHGRYGDGRFRLSSKEMGWFWKLYLGDRAPREEPLAEPLYADLSGLPPIFLNYGTVDPLADDTRELAARLDQAGVVHECLAYPGLVHGFLQMTERVEASRRAMAEAGRAIARLFA